MRPSLSTGDELMNYSTNCRRHPIAWHVPYGPFRGRVAYDNKTLYVTYNLEKLTP